MIYINVLIKVPRNFSDVMCFFIFTAAHTPNSKSNISNKPNTMNIVCNPIKYVSIALTATPSHPHIVENMVAVLVRIPKVTVAIVSSISVFVL
jgi:hypothetical protein